MPLWPRSGSRTGAHEGFMGGAVAEPAGAMKASWGLGQNLAGGHEAFWGLFQGPTEAHEGVMGHYRGNPDDTGHFHDQPRRPVRCSKPARRRAVLQRKAEPTMEKKARFAMEEGGGGNVFADLRFPHPWLSGAQSFSRPSCRLTRTYRYVYVSIKCKTRPSPPAGSHRQGRT